MDELSKDQITIGRLKKKIEKLKNQRDSYKKKYEHYKLVFNESPYVESRYNRYMAFIENTKTLKADMKQLEARCKEQAMLIDELSKDK